MTFAVFAISATAGILLVLLSAATWLIPRIAFWPPPKVESWQYRVFWLMFRVLVLGVLILSFIDFGALGQPARWRIVVGAVGTVVGFGLAFWATYALGWRDAHGEAISLKTTGWYSWSRNPVYVVSIVGMLGVGILVNSGYVTTLLLLWAFLYVIAPFLEEPWLERTYGSAFRAYKAQVGRFFGRRARET